MPSPLLVFANPASGGGLAADIISKLENEESVYIVKLPDQASTFQDDFSSLIHDENLRCIAAGGDGTVNWVVSLLLAVYGNDENVFRPPLGVLPLGTGNDMSRTLGWGKTVNNRRIANIKNDLRAARRSTHVENVDIWDVTIKRTDRPDTVVSKQMLNYFSIGVDAEIAKDFEDFRNGCCGCCICCQCMSLCCYVPVSMKNLCGKRPIRDYLDIDIECNDDFEIVTKKLKPGRNEKTFVLQAIPSIYAGRDLWGNHGPRSVSDGKLEVLTEGGVWRLGFAQIGFNTAKPFAQGVKAVIEASEPFYYQIDGEGYCMNGPSHVEVTRVGSYPLIFCDKKKSKM